MKKRDKKRVIRNEILLECKKCGQLMECREHEKITPETLKQPYYFKKWYVCKKKGCNHIQHFEENKVKKG